MNPTTGIADRCARAVSDHATTVLLKSLMNSRRLMGFTPLAENHLRKSLIRSSSESYVPHCIRVGRPMSALGHKRTLKRLHPMSAIPPKADMQGCCNRISARSLKDYDGGVDLPQQLG